MKKTIDICCEYEHLGGDGVTSVLHIRKQRGKFTLDEIIEALKEREWDTYVIIVKATGEDGIQYDEDTSGDFVRAVSIDHVSFK